MKPTAIGLIAWRCSARTRGDARLDSDYDVTVFLKQPRSFWQESGRLAEIETDILCDTGAIIKPYPLPPGADDDASPLMQELGRDGLDLLLTRSPATWAKRGKL
jgi:hypothetical protein